MDGIAAPDTWPVLRGPRLRLRFTEAAHLCRRPGAVSARKPLPRRRPVPRGRRQGGAVQAETVSPGFPTFPYDTTPWALACAREERAVGGVFAACPGSGEVHRLKLRRCRRGRTPSPGSLSSVAVRGNLCGLVSPRPLVPANAGTHSRSGIGPGLVTPHRFGLRDRCSPPPSMGSCFRRSERLGCLRVLPGLRGGATIEASAVPG